MIKFEIRNRWSGSVQLTAEIDCDEDAWYGVKVGLAVKWAMKSGAVLCDAVLCDAVLCDADLRGADLCGAVLCGAVLRGADLCDAVLRDADLRGAVLCGADLRGADLCGAVLCDAVLCDAVLRDADLRGADLCGAVLRSFKADMWMTLAQNRNEVPGLIKALRDGRIDGSQYTGECACLVGTIANVKGVNVQTLPKNSNNPAEQWFLMIHKGDKPGDDTGGGFAAKVALEWATEWAALNGVAVDEPAEAA